MKSITDSFKNESLASEATTLCTCWKITRVDGVIFRFTDLDIDLTVAGETYIAAVGYNRTATSTSGDMSVDNLDVEGIIDDNSLTVEALRAGVFNGASVEVFLVDWMNPEFGIMRVRKGIFGEVSLAPSGRFKTELRGLNQYLSQNVGEVTSPTCRADLGDARCKVPINDPSYYRDGTVTGVTDRRTFSLAIASPDPRATDPTWYVDGILTWLTGDNTGRNIEVKTWDGVGTISLFLSMPYNMQVGDTFRVRPGCDKRLTTCIHKFNNVVNFRGEPFVPGQDLMSTYPDLK